MPFDLALLFFVPPFITSITLSHFLFISEKEKKNPQNHRNVQSQASQMDFNHLEITSQRWIAVISMLLLFSNGQVIHSFNEWRENVIAFLTALSKFIESGDDVDYYIIL